MSFPSAALEFERTGDAEASLLHAMQHDTQLGFKVLSLLVASVKSGEDPVGPLRQQLFKDGCSHDVIRSEQRGQGWKIDFNPNSKLGGEVARLMTDACRPLLTQHFGLYFGFANCCGVAGSKDKDDVVVTAKDQIRWQLAPDC